MRPTRDEILMEIARIVARRGTCERLKVGAVLAVEGRIVSMGYTGAPSGLPHCDPSICNLDQACTRTVHAETNAIAFAARRGLATEGATLYCTHSPCLDCAKIIVNAGITTVFYETTYRKTEGIDLLLAAGVDVRVPVSLA